MQKARRHPEGLRPLVSTWFQVLFTPLIGVLFIVHSRYWFTIGRRGVLRLGGWTPHVQSEFHELEPTLGLTSHNATGLSPSVVRLSRRLTLIYWLIRFRSALLTESRLLSFPPGTEMFQFSGFASPKPILFSLVIPLPFNL